MPPAEGGIIESKLVSAPGDLRCLQLTVTQGATTTTKKVAVTGTAAVFTASGLPIGMVTVSEQAFTQACASVAAATVPKWTSDTQSATLNAGQPVSLVFVLHLSSAGGIVNAQSQFPDPLGGFTRLTNEPTSTSVEYATLGPKDEVWFTTSSATTGKLGHVDVNGTVIENVSFTTGAGSAGALGGIAHGPDGRLWIGRSTQLMRLDPVNFGILQSFNTASATPGIDSVIVGPDGNIWFAEGSASAIGRITVTGVMTEFPVTAGSTPRSLAVGPDGNLWFTELTANKIGRITPAGVLVEFSVPTAASRPYNLAVGSDGNLWFTEEAGNKIGRITPAGAITEFALPLSGALPNGIVQGPDGNIWFGQTLGLGRITPAGVVTNYLGVSQSPPRALTVGADAKIYFSFYEPVASQGGYARLDPTLL